MHFTFHQKVLFKHCDPAGIVFYPRYFEMINDAVEALFSDRLGWPFEDMHPDGGVPTASFKVDFNAPSRHGDALALHLTITRLGGASMGLRTLAVSDDEQRFQSDQVLVCVDGKGRPTHWPAPVRSRAMELMEGPQ